MTVKGGLLAALDSKVETACLDFKSEFNPLVPRDWLEIIKDIVAFANSGGGIIIVGLDNDGVPLGVDVGALLAVDPADVANKIHKYTGQNYAGVELVRCEKNGFELCAICIAPTRVPIAFSRVGEFELADSKKKTVFAIGTVYFRHGAKSEPGTSEDFRAFLERELEHIKKSWLDGIAKVVEAPPGSRVAIYPPEDGSNGSLDLLSVQLTSDPAAPAYYPVPLDETHPFRQKEVIREVNLRLAGKKFVNAHDILCIRRVHAIHENINFCYTQSFASPRYSNGFVEWIVQEFSRNSNFFDDTKLKYEESRKMQSANLSMKA